MLELDPHQLLPKNYYPATQQDVGHTELPPAPPLDERRYLLQSEIDFVNYLRKRHRQQMHREAASMLVHFSTVIGE